MLFCLLDIVVLYMIPILDTPAFVLSRLPFHFAFCLDVFFFGFGFALLILTFLY